MYTRLASNLRHVFAVFLLSACGPGPLLAVGLPAVFSEADPDAFLASYVATYLREEVQQEGLVRSLPMFSRFLEAASFAQANVLNVSVVARECAVDRKTTENFFGILEDPLLAVRLPIFERRVSRDRIDVVPVAAGLRDLAKAL